MGRILVNVQFILEGILNVVMKLSLFCWVKCYKVRLLVVQLVR